MTMTLGDLLEMVRQDYVDQFLAAAEDLQKNGGEVEFEPVMAGDEDEPRLEGVLQLPLRADLVVLGEVERQVRVEPEGIFRFDGAIAFDWEGMQLEVFPFGWDMVPLTLHGVPADTKWEPMQQWFWRWFAEPEEPAQGPLQEVIHFLSDPDTQAGTTRFMADLGSAPLEAWQDLLDACKACGTQKLVLGSALSDLGDV